MAKKILHILFCYFVFSTTLNLSAATVSEDKMDVWDRSKIAYRHPSVEKMESYKHMNEYIYDRAQKPDSLWDQFKRWIWQKLFSNGINPSIISYILIAIAIIILFSVTLLLLGIKPSGLFIFKRNQHITPIKFKAGEEDIYNQDLDHMLQGCVRNKAYREAIRLQYLICIRHLDQSQWIEWKPWKTNKEYYYELKQAEHKVEFKNLVLNYEYIWYGQFTIDQSHFDEIQDKFKRFANTVTSGKSLKEGGHATKK